MSAEELAEQLGEVTITKYRCRQQNCASVVKRLDKHLREQHQMKTGTDSYKTAMANSLLPENKIVLTVVNDDNEDDEGGEEMDNAAAPNVVANVEEGGNPVPEAMEEAGVSDSDSDTPLIRYVGRKRWAAHQPAYAVLI